MLDVAIVLALLAGIVAGWRKGFVVPLVAQAGALLGFALVFSGPLSANVPSGPVGLGAGVLAAMAGSYALGTVGSILIGLAYRFAPLKRADKLLGVPLGAVAAGVTVYVALVATVTVDGWLAPLHDKGSLTTVEVNALSQIVAANPAAGAFVDQSTLAALAAAAAKTPVAQDQLAKFSAALGFYETDVRPQLVTSRIAPAVLELGARLPVIGTTVTYPAP